MPRKPAYVPVLKVIDSKMAYVSESGRAFFLDDFAKASDAKRAAMFAERSGMEVATMLQANDRPDDDDDDDEDDDED